MDDMYVKPGNQERGWNDPPQFSYGLQMARSTQRNLLNKRAAPGTGTPPMTPPIHNSLAPPPVGVATPPRSSAGPPPSQCVATPPSTEAVGSQCAAISSQSEAEPDVDAVLSVLKQALAACGHSVKAQVCNDMSKRLHLLEDCWRGGRLSLPVRRRMENLSQELQSAHWDSADEIHRSLMVDHVAEVSQWMVGVKRLIAETRNLKPEVLDFIHKPTEPVGQPDTEAEDSVEFSEEPSSPTKELTEPSEPANPVLD